jgi:hypothetical protein
MKEVIGILEEKGNILSAQRQAVKGLEGASGSRKLALETRTSLLDARLGALDSRRKIIEGQLELLMLEHEGIEDVLDMGI